MTTIKDIFTTYDPEYIQRFGGHMPAEHRKVIDAIINCRTGHNGISIYQCTQCGERHMVYRCCGKWNCSRIDFFLPVKAMSKIFKARIEGDILLADYLMCLHIPRLFLHQILLG